MKEQLLQLFRDHPQAAFGISILINVLIALAGVLPSFFITAANILFFGFWPGFLLSFIGEALGAIIAFALYRKGLRKQVSKGLERFPRAQKLVHARGREAAMLVLSLRLIPFVPSGLVTFAASVGEMSLLHFALSSSLGKLPALFIEAWSVKEVSEFGTTGKIILALTALILIWVVVRKKRS